MCTQCSRFHPNRFAFGGVNSGTREHPLFLPKAMLRFGRIITSSVDIFASDRPKVHAPCFDFRHFGFQLISASDAVQNKPVRHRAKFRGDRCRTVAGLTIFNIAAVRHLVFFKCKKLAAVYREG